jgi:oxygen-independent coproporphyrinogen-3 oxidase
MIILATKLISKFTLKIFKLAGIYIHIPFCKQACYYCDFHFSTNLSLVPDLFKCILHEISLQKEYFNGESIETIYLGGGTPSILSIEKLDRILKTVFDNYTIVSDPEITIEANPDDLTPGKLANLYKTGFNRLSIGIQSFDDNILKYLHRAHSTQMAVEAYESARKAGFENINIDLIFAVHPDSNQFFSEDITQAIYLHPEHISAYNLTIESKTVFGNWLKKGKIQEADEEESAKQYESLINRLIGAGYDQYEISNFSLPDKYSKHNMNYWKGKSYLGVGPGAHSFNQLSRQFNINNNARYIQNLKMDVIPFEIINLSGKELINEFILTNLRTKWGINLSIFEKRFAYKLTDAKKSKIKNLQENDLIENTTIAIRLTNKGKLLADSIASDLFID